MPRMIVILTSEEREAVRKIAKLDRRSMSNWMHWTILQEIRKHAGVTPGISLPAASTTHQKHIPLAHPNETFEQYEERVRRGFTEKVAVQDDSDMPAFLKGH